MDATNDVSLATWPPIDADLLRAEKDRMARKAILFGRASRKARGLRPLGTPTRVGRPRPGPGPDVLRGLRRFHEAKDRADRLVRTVQKRNRPPGCERGRPTYFGPDDMGRVERAYAAAMRANAARRDLARLARAR